ncbi:MmcQ/YjbR family DNA-binding protein [Sphingomonas sp. 2378]|uniref:MmcQ/YjbR family DNA-binding protein n=1 Tax=Sphingomonas sp. 2378 TaxID=1219748 RepID=UPI00311B26AD
MTDHLSRIRDIAMLLPGTTEEAKDGEACFLVEGEAFVRVSTEAATLHVCTADPSNEPCWADIPLSGDVDWTLVEDRIARSWELVAPTALLEAGGR